MSTVEVAAVDLQVWVRPGALLLVQPAETGQALALRPLESSTAIAPPLDMAQWTPMAPGTCQSPTVFRWTRGLQERTATATGSWARPVVEVRVDDTLVATTAMERPAHLCALFAGDLDPLPGEEVVVLCQTRAPGEHGPTTRGVSVYRLPVTAQ